MAWPIRFVVVASALSGIPLWCGFACRRHAAGFIYPSGQDITHFCKKLSEFIAEGAICSTAERNYLACNIRGAHTRLATQGAPGQPPARIGAATACSPLPGDDIAVSLAENVRMPLLVRRQAMIVFCWWALPAGNSASVGWRGASSLGHRLRWLLGGTGTMHR